MYSAILSGADVETTRGRHLDIQHTEYRHTKGADQRPEIGHIELFRPRKKERRKNRCRKKVTEGGRNSEKIKYCKQRRGYPC